MDGRKKALAVIIVIAVAAIIAAFALFQNPTNGIVEGGNPNCSKTYNLSTGASIASNNDFLEFLKSRQSSDKLTNKWSPTEGKIVPASNAQGQEIKLDDFLEKIIVKNSADSKTYSLSISNSDFNESYPWRIQINSSSSGQVSWSYCAGI